MQARLLENNPLVMYEPCMAHSLNLVGLHPSLVLAETSMFCVLEAVKVLTKNIHGVIQALNELKEALYQPETKLEAGSNGDLMEAFLNVCVALRIYITLPTSTGCERSFSKLKLIKNFILRS
ncbi:hypothetical protein PR048_001208 [Dryococelus australis]|uniref:HAT C-terminal dimerisation domain-containing protein n=1 Tax=Dryococelus australis TaxID=614101 RepID=A0ABQ9IJ49_9NEOP|nr:hypothetical protein PR048_001208 [Dryococelus australis]